MDVEAIHAARRGRIAQALKGGPDQRGAAIAFVDEGQIVHERESVDGDALTQGGHLAGDSVGAGLLLRGDARIKGGLDIHQEPILSTRRRAA